MVTVLQNTFQTPKRPTYVDSEVPIKDPSNWNDDQAERKARRRSGAGDGKNRRSMLFSPLQKTPNRKSLSQPLHVTGTGALLSPGSALQRLTPEELNRRYEEWMKIAADNKINATNTWDVALIDYFYDMSLLRDGDSINFQKASCTLDGCVKIYSSRVDSVATETGKLLNGLAESPTRGGSRRRSRADGDDDDEGDSTEGTTKAKHRRRAARSENTLAKDFAAISIKKFDLEFTVDPLFKKTSADFDEGGARGLLLNHLTLDAESKIIFDASDAAVGSAPDAQSDSTVKPEDDTMAVDHTPFVPASLDYSLLQARFFPDLARASELDVCPSLKNFEFSKDDSLDIALLKHTLFDNSDDEEQANPLESDAHPLLDDDGGAASPFGAGDDDGGMGWGFGGDDGEGDTGGDGAALGSAGAEGQDGYVAHAADQPQLTLTTASDEHDIFSYFDSKLIKSWAGPDHWKLHPALRVKPAGASDEAKHESKRARTEKQKYMTNFSDQPDLDETQLFAPPPRNGSLTVVSGYHKGGQKNNRHLLPEDIQFTSKNLVSLFLKPRCRIRSWSPNAQGDLALAMVNPALNTQPAAATDALGEELLQPELGLATDAAKQSFVGDGNEPLHAEGNDSGVDDDMELGDGFGIDMDDGMDAMDELVPELSQVQQLLLDGEPTMPSLKVIKPLYVNYARTAKRVDVKKLKDNLWHKLITFSDATATPNADDAAMPTDADNEEDTPFSHPSDGVQGEQRFSDVIDSLKTVYPERSIKDISVPFCFICLLHLANEKNLCITSDSALEDLVITQDPQLSPTPSY
ncbi:hypothetical protein H4R34_001402 [Dimargaris verticillata]|uniref:Condensin complex subunit 2 n=1 Tax=Dimargaris verticillata TaxID=2761393 RepID=A0A9W8B696_9FUNG|nr:hypothetical protein H4R34_001402 [Dimargaris verticillata]